MPVPERGVRPLQLTDLVRESCAVCSIASFGGRRAFSSRLWDAPDARRSQCWDERVARSIFECPSDSIPTMGPDTSGRPPDVPDTGLTRLQHSPHALRLCSLNRINSTGSQALGSLSTLSRATRWHGWHTRCFVLQRQPTSLPGHFLKEIVMRNFIYAITLVGLAVLQVAIVVAEFTGV